MRTITYTRRIILVFLAFSLLMFVRPDEQGIERDSVTQQHNAIMLSGNFTELTLMPPPEELLPLNTVLLSRTRSLNGCEPSRCLYFLWRRSALIIALYIGMGCYKSFWQRRKLHQAIPYKVHT